MNWEGRLVLRDCTGVLLGWLGCWMYLPGLDKVLCLRRKIWGSWWICSENIGGADCCYDSRCERGIGGLSFSIVPLLMSREQGWM